MSDRAAACIATLYETKIINVIRTNSTVSLVPVMDALSRGGVKIIEITASCPQFERQISDIRKYCESHPGCFVGAGTILTIEEANLAKEAGADFVVSPVYDPEVFSHCKSLGLITMPGCQTPSEAYAAWKAGADVVKAFPGNVCTPKWFADMRGPLGMIPMLPTGNVNETTAPQYIQAGAVAVGIGRALASEEQIVTGDWGAIEAQAKHFSAIVRGALS